MARRRPLVASNGLPTELPAADRLTGLWSARIAVAVGGSVSATIPAGIFGSLPAIGHSIFASGTRDYVFRGINAVLNADKTITVTGTIRESKIIPGLSGTTDTFVTLSSAVTLHLIAVEID